jgi:hypothetical protein
MLMSRTPMRRWFAIPMLFVFLLPLVSGFLETSVVEASLPACCRRGGQHHCDLIAEQTSDSKGAIAIREKCPYSPAALSVVVLPTFAPPAAAAIFAGVMRHVSVSPQADALRRISFDRARQKRGPPSLLA